MTETRCTRQIVFDDLVCAQVLAESQLLSGVEEVDVGGGGPPVHAGTADNVLYLPDRGLQVLCDRFVPLEATPYPGALAYVQKASMSDGRGRYQGLLEVREADEDVCILSNIWSNNIYHWMEELFKVTVLEISGF
jgi:hypothetical protein